MNKVYALKEGGKKLWSYENGRIQIWISSPCVGPDGTVYVGSNDHKVYALKNGKKLWEYENGELCILIALPGP